MASPNTQYPKTMFDRFFDFQFFSHFLFVFCSPGQKNDKKATQTQTKEILHSLPQPPTTPASQLAQIIHKACNRETYQQPFMVAPTQQPRIRSRRGVRHPQTPIHKNLHLGLRVRRRRRRRCFPAKGLRLNRCVHPGVITVKATSEARRPLRMVC